MPASAWWDGKRKLSLRAKEITGEKRTGRAPGYAVPARARLRARYRRIAEKRITVTVSAGVTSRL
jgi:hypothetical protein